MNQVIDLDRDLVGAFGPRPVGSLKIRIRQCDETGEGNPPADMNVQNPNQLLGKRMWFRVEVISAKNVPPEFNKDLFVTYNFKFDPIIYATDEIKGFECNPFFSYSKTHCIDNFD